MSSINTNFIHKYKFRKAGTAHCCCATYSGRNGKREDRETVMKTKEQKPAKKSARNSSLGKNVSELKLSGACEGARHSPAAITSVRVNYGALTVTMTDRLGSE